MLELAREIGYELNPGVAAATYLAFTVDAPLVPEAALPMPATIPLPAGQKVQSVPGPGQQPQMFETVAAITAHVAWNEMRARATQRQELAVDAKGGLFRVDPETGEHFVARSLWLAGTASNVRVGDLLYVSVGPGSWLQDPVPGLEKGIACIFVANVDVDYQLGRTRVDLDQPGQTGTPQFYMPPQPKGVVSLTPLALTLANVRESIVGRDWDEADLRAYIAIQKWDEDELLRLVSTVVATVPPAADVFVFRNKTALFGHNAPSYQQIHSAFLNSQKSGVTDPWPGDWDSPANDIYSYFHVDPHIWFDSFQVDIFLDRVLPLRAGSLVALGSAHVHPPRPFVIGGVADVSLVAFGMSGKATGLVLDQPWTNPPPPNTYHGRTVYWDYKMRETSAYVQSEPVALTDAPIDEPVGNVEITADSLVLDRMILGLDPGQKVAITGIVAGSYTAPSGVEATEIAELLRVVHGRGYTTLQFAQALQNAYVRSTITINANLAPATHGESVNNEILGSGDAAQKNQTFQLAKAPLTYVPAANAAGARDTLIVRVDGVAWREVPTLYGAAPNDTVFTVRHGDDGSTVVRFGDGVVGARLPSGSNNVVASYRGGLGPDGNTKAESIAILGARPYGLKSAVNPVPASGGAAAEPLADARQNAPRTVRTLERIVSLADFTDFARGFAGVAKAVAVPLWSGETRVVHITVAGADGASIDRNSPQWSNLVSGMQSAGDSAHLVQIDNFQQAYFKLTANIVVDPRRELPVVMAQVNQVLRQSFSFAARALAQTVTEAEVIEYAQAVPGVIAIEVSELYRADEAAGIGGTLPATGAHFVNGKIIPAELLLLHPVGLSLLGANP